MIRIGILGYGNLGRGIECAVKHTKDMKLVAVFTRRDPSSVKTLTPDAKVENIENSSTVASNIYLYLCISILEFKCCYK